MDSLEGLKVVELKKLLKAKKLPIYGKKEVLVKRLRDYFKTHDEKESVDEITVGVEDIAFVEDDIEVVANSEASADCEKENFSEVSCILTSNLNTSLYEDLSVNDLSKIDFENENFCVQQIQRMNAEALVKANKEDDLFKNLPQPGIRKSK